MRRAGSCIGGCPDESLYALIYFFWCERVHHHNLPRYLSRPLSANVFKHLDPRHALCRAKSALNADFAFTIVLD